jgi:hypothetical protein
MLGGERGRKTNCLKLSQNSFIYNRATNNIIIIIIKLLNVYIITFTTRLPVMNSHHKRLIP